MMSNTVKGQELMENKRLEHEYLEQVVKQHLTDKLDYLKTDSGKLCLLKSGAEKLCDYYGFSVQLDLVESTGSQIKEMAMYTVKAVLSDIESGAQLAEGLGMASSQESRYEKQNSVNVANTILKMAKKRAMVDAVITAVHGSFLFTQDLEDMQSAYEQLKENTKQNTYNFNNQNKQRENTQKQNYNRNSGYNNRKQDNWNKNSTQPKNAGNNNYRKNNSGGGNSTAIELVTDRQIYLIEKLIAQQRISRDQVLMELEKRYQTLDYRKLDKKQASDFIQALQQMTAWAS